jgi:hypothetical protein
MAKGAGGGGGGSMGMHGHGHMGHHHHFRNNPFLFGGGWGWGWGGYGDNGYGNTTVVAFPQATPQAAGVTGSIATGPCHWNADTFKVPSAGAVIGQFRS